MRRLYYIHDPMCSWCWAFHPVATEVFARLPDDIELVYLLGGLAADSDIPMDESTQEMIQQHWHTIAHRLPDTPFNFDFWSSNTPRRSTYPACRAVIAAKKQRREKEMILAIQQAYYLSALNPSDEATLLQCARTIGLDSALFQKDLHAEATQKQLLNEVRQTRALSVFSFPSLLLENQGKFQTIGIDYTDAGNILNQLP